MSASVRGASPERPRIVTSIPGLRLECLKMSSAATAGPTTSPSVSALSLPSCVPLDERDVVIDLRLLRLMLFLGALWTCKLSTNFDWLQKLSTTPLQLADENVPCGKRHDTSYTIPLRGGFNSRSSATSTQN